MLIAMIKGLPFALVNGNFFECEITLDDFKTGKVQLGLEKEKYNCLYSVGEIRHYFLKVKNETVLSSLEFQGFENEEKGKITTLDPGDEVTTEDLTKAVEDVVLTENEKSSSKGKGKKNK